MARKTITRGKMRSAQPLTPEQQFFFTWGAYSYDPKTETPEQGRTRCAIESAEAESLYLQAHRVADVSCNWEDDPDGAYFWRKDGQKFNKCERADIAHNRKFLASLGAIMDADANYRRVIRAELAHECADELRAIIAKG